jgi:hypothetical protein
MQPSQETYQFPIQLTESTHFSARGAYIDKAVLIANDMLISIIRPTYDESIDDLMKKSIPAPPVDLPFFGDKPFHGALAAKWQLKVILYSHDAQMPALSFSPADETITWNDVAGDVYEDVVRAGSDAGEVTKTFIYTQTRGGFKRTARQ